MSLFPSPSTRSHYTRKMCGETLRESMTLMFLFDLQCRSNGLDATTVGIDSKFLEVGHNLPCMCPFDKRNSQAVADISIHQMSDCGLCIPAQCKRMGVLSMYNVFFVQYS